MPALAFALDAAPARRPIIIEAGWTVADLQTLADCDDALAILEDQAERIERDLDEHAEEIAIDEAWYGKAEMALALKKVGIRQVKALRDRLVAEGEYARFKAAVKGLDPDVFRRASAIAEAAAR